MDKIIVILFWVALIGMVAHQLATNTGTPGHAHCNNYGCGPLHVHDPDDLPDDWECVGTIRGKASHGCTIAKVSE